MRIAFVCDPWVYDRHWRLLSAALSEFQYDKYTTPDFLFAQDAEEGIEPADYGANELLPHIENQKYDAVIACGNNALVALHISKKPQGINKFRMRENKFDHIGCPVFATLSPSAVAREPHMYDDFSNDLRFIRNHLTGGEIASIEVDIVDVTDPKQLAEIAEEWNKNKQIVHYDFETTTLDRREAEVVAATFCTGKLPSGAYRVYFWAGYDKLEPLFDADTFQQFLDVFTTIFKNPNVKRKAWNHSYDDWVSETWLGDVFPLSIEDVMYKKWAVETSRPHGLKQAVSKYGGFPNYDAELDENFRAIKKRREKVLEKEDLWILDIIGKQPVFDSKNRPKWPKEVDKGVCGYALIDFTILRKYACYDAAYTCYLDEIFEEIIQENDLQTSVWLRHAISHECLRAEQRGEVLDSKTNRKFSKELERVSVSIRKQLDDWAYKIADIKEFNPDSPVQLAKILYGECATVPVIDRRRLYRQFDRDSVDVICAEVEEKVYGDYEEVKAKLESDEFDVDAAFDVFFEKLQEMGAEEQLTNSFEWYVENKDADAKIEDWLFVPRPIGLGGLKLNPPALTKKGSPSCSKSSLLTLQNKCDHEFLSLVLMWRKATKLKKDFIDKIYNCRDESGLVRTSYNPTGTISGRLSSSGNYNAQNFPKKVRGQIIARDGYNFLELDLKNAEVFTLAAFTNDENLMAACMNSDTHRYVASLLFNKAFDEVTDDERQVGKMSVFLTLYGGGPDKLAAATRLTVPRASEVQHLLTETFTDMKSWFAEMHAQAETEPYYVRTAFGTRISTKDILSSDLAIKSHVQRVSTNAPIQGSAGEYNLYLIHRCMTEARKQGWALPLDQLGIAPFMFNNTVHDSIRFEVSEDLAWHDEDNNVCGPAYDLVRAVLDEPIPFHPLDRIKFRADIELNKCWAGPPDLKKALGEKTFRWDLIKDEDTDEEEEDDFSFLT